MKAAQLIEECKKRKTKKMCDTCPHKQACERLMRLVRDMCPSSYDGISELEV